MKKPPGPPQRAGAAIEKVKAELRKGNKQMAYQELTKLKELKEKEEELAPFITEEALKALEGGRDTLLVVQLLVNGILRGVLARRHIHIHLEARRQRSQQLHADA